MVRRSRQDGMDSVRRSEAWAELENSWTEQRAGIPEGHEPTLVGEMLLGPVLRILEEERRRRDKENG
jgi:hypothetical protein